MKIRMLPLAFLVACGAPANHYVTANSPPPARNVSVTGTARIDLVPNESCVELTLSARNIAIDAAHGELMRHVDLLIETLDDVDDLSVERGAIRYSPYYEDHHTSRARIIAGHAATAQINVRTQDFERIPDIITHAATRGLERVNVQFYSTELVEQKAALLRLALQAARDKAGDMAETLGTSVGAVVSIRETAASMHNRPALANMVVAAPTGSAPALPPQPGSIPLSISVDVVYDLGE